MREKFGNDIYESWLKKIEFVEELKNYVLLSVSTLFHFEPGIIRKSKENLVLFVVLTFEKCLH